MSTHAPGTRGEETKKATSLIVYAVQFCKQSKREHRFLTS